MLFSILGLLGAIFVLIGRRMIICQARQISTGWVWAIRFLPLAEIMFLARYWDLGRNGAILSLVGMAMLAPIGLQTLSEKRHLMQAESEGDGQETEMTGDPTDYFAMVNKKDTEARIEVKETKLQGLNAHMKQWYASLQARRAALPEDATDQIGAFNDEAAAYQSLLSVAKEETAQLAQLKAGPQSTAPRSKGASAK